jgi:hypothetical protein
LKEVEPLNKHIAGAEALLQLRGKQQLETVLGRNLFAQVRAQVVSLYAYVEIWQQINRFADNKVLADKYSRAQ